MQHDNPPAQGSLLIYQGDDGHMRVECRVHGDTLWLSQSLMAELFQRSKKTISEHLSNIFAEGELDEQAVVRNFQTTAADGKTYQVVHYSLDAVLAVGYRVRSTQGTRFRQWATALLREYLVTGFAMDDERLKTPDNSVYFEQLLARIRDIRSSEKVFWRKICDIFASSIDYDGKVESSMQFFASVQNKMHWAAHGHTAAELIHARANADLPNMGVSTPAQRPLRKADVAVAKNYLNADELDTLNRIVTAYLEFAELQAKRGRLMRMADWSAKLDDFLKLSDHELLAHLGKISAEQAKIKAEAEYMKYQRIYDAQPDAIERDFAEALVRLEGKGKTQ
jgi:hypothetical protein